MSMSSSFYNQQFRPHLILMSGYIAESKWNLRVSPNEPWSDTTHLPYVTVPWYVWGRKLSSSSLLLLSLSLSWSLHFAIRQNQPISITAITLAALTQERKYVTEAPTDSEFQRFWVFIADILAKILRLLPKVEKRLREWMWLILHHICGHKIHWWFSHLKFTKQQMCLGVTLLVTTWYVLGNQLVPHTLLSRIWFCPNNAIFAEILRKLLAVGDSDQWFKLVW